MRDSPGKKGDKYNWPAILPTRIAISLMDRQALQLVDDSLHRCAANPAFLDLFYERFLNSSPRVREKFANTDFVHQKRALMASFHLMLLAAEDEEQGPQKYLRDIAARHGKAQLDIGTQDYDLWLDSLLETVRGCDPECSAEIEQAWERVLGVGIKYLLEHYNHPPRRRFRL
jgi:hemoglobin-like flavoprotein